MVCFKAAVDYSGLLSSATQKAVAHGWPQVSTDHNSQGFEIATLWGSRIYDVDLTS
jgi:hypothetical protein